MRDAGFEMRGYGLFEEHNLDPQCWQILDRSSDADGESADAVYRIMRSSNRCSVVSPCSAMPSSSLDFAGVCRKSRP